MVDIKRHETDQVINRDQLVIPSTDMDSWSTPDHVYSFLGDLLTANWRPLAQGLWSGVEEFINTPRRKLADFDLGRVASTAIIIRGTGLSIYGVIEGESERTCREREEHALSVQRGYNVHTVGTITYSVGDENTAEHASVKKYLQHGSGDAVFHRNIHLYGTIPAEIPLDDMPPRVHSRVQAVASFIRSRFIE